MHLSEKAPIRPISDEQLEKVKEVFKTLPDAWKEPIISRTSEGFEVEQMYEYVTINFDVLSRLAEILGTKNIDTDLFSTEGCETCDYGSSYRVEFIVREEL